MKLKTNREELLSQLDIISPGLSPKDIIEQSSCFVFNDGKLFTFNDEIACQIETNVKMKGAVSANSLIESLRKLKDEYVTLSLGEGVLIVKAKNKEIGIRMEAEILLPVEEVEAPEDWTDLPDDFADAVELISECVSKNEDHFKLTCVHLASKYLEACDNFQIGRYRIDIGLESSILIRAASLKNTVTLGVTQYSLTDSWLHFKNPKGLVMSCRRQEDTEGYPDFGSFATHQGEDASFPKALGEAAELAEIFSSQNTDHNEVVVSLRPGKLMIMGEGSSGWSKEVKKIEYDGDPLSFKIAPKLLQRISDTFTKCKITDSTLSVSGGKYTYATALGEIA